MVHWIGNEEHALTPTPLPSAGRRALTRWFLRHLSVKTVLPLARVQWERGLGGEGTLNLSLSLTS